MVETTQPLLIEPGQLAALIDAGEPLVLADVRWWLGGPPGKTAYEEGHIPGAQYVDLESELSGHHRPDGAGGRHPLPDPEAFVASMRRIGVSPTTLVVVYDPDTSLAASRLWWLLGDAGHEHVRVLNGGYAGWLAAGLPIETGPGRPVRPGTFAGEPGQWARVDGATLADRIADGQGGPVVDVRAEERYRGEVEPMDPVAGHIPSAVNLPSTLNLSTNGRFLDPAALSARFAELGDGPVFYCGSGITAAHTLLALRVAGRSDGSIYPGSWSDWITDPTRPVSAGPDPA